MTKPARVGWWMTMAIAVYLLVVGVGAAVLVIANFPDDTNGKLVFPFTFEVAGEANPLLWPVLRLRSANQALLALAFLAGIAGSFIHTAQSLASYLGNQAFKGSWTVWYLLRPWIGGTLGFALYFVIRAGFVGGGGEVNPFGLIAVALLGGWFSKTTTDKLQEVFETLFRTSKDLERSDKLTARRPVIEGFVPPTIPVGVNAFRVGGRHFQKGAVVLIDGVELAPRFESARVLDVTLTPGTRPSAGEANVQVKNPTGSEPVSEGAQLTFE